MRTNHLVRLGLLLAFALLAGGLGLYVWVSGSGKQNVTFTVTCPKKQFKLGDEILVTLTVSNNGCRRFPYPRSWLQRIPCVGRNFGQKGTPWNNVGVLVRDPNGSLCVDPQMILPKGLGPGYAAILAVEPGKSDSAIVSLNMHALISNPGTHLVFGTVMQDTQASGVSRILLCSDPIEIVIKPRTHDEMGQHINSLLKGLKEAKDSSGKRTIIRKLACTRDRRVVPALLNSEYAGHATGRLYQALICDLPLDSQIKEMILHTVKEQGLLEHTAYAMWRFGCTDKEFSEPIAISLASDDQRHIRAGIMMAIQYPDDSHLPRLIELVSHPVSLVRKLASWAIAVNHSEEAASTLKNLLYHPDEKIKRDVRRGYQIAQDSQATSKPEMSSKVIAKAKDRNSPERWVAVRQLMDRLNDEDFAAIKAMVDQQAEDIAIEASQAVQTIAVLLRHQDRDVRDVTITLIRFTRKTYPWPY